MHGIRPWVVWVAVSFGLGGCLRIVGIDDPDAAVDRPDVASRTTFVTPGDVDRPCVPGSGGQPGSPWPMSGGGPEHHGRSDLVGPAQPNVKWTRDLNGWIAYSSLNGYADIALAADGTLYVPVSTRNSLYLGYLLALNPAGEVRWTLPELVSGLAIGRHGTVYATLEAKHQVVGLDPGGEVLWQSNHGFSVLSSVTLAGDGVAMFGEYFWNACDHPPCPQLGFLQALAPSGERRFTVQSDWVILNPPAFGTDCTIYLTGHYDVVALDPGGREQWRVSTDAEFSNTTPTIGPDGTLYAFGHAFRVETDSSVLVAVSPSGELKWQFPIRGKPRGIAVGLDGTLYLGECCQDEGELWAVSPEGHLRWTLPIAGMVYSAPTVDAAGVIYVGTEGDGLYAIDPEGTVKWHFDPGDSGFMRPIIGENRTLYVGARVAGWASDEGRIYALGE